MKLKNNRLQKILAKSRLNWTRMYRFRRRLIRPEYVYDSGMVPSNVKHYFTSRPAIELASKWKVINPDNAVNGGLKRGQLMMVSSGPHPIGYKSDVLGFYLRKAMAHKATLREKIIKANPQATEEEIAAALEVMMSPLSRNLIERYEKNNRITAEIEGSVNLDITLQDVKHNLKEYTREQQHN